MGCINRHRRRRRCRYRKFKRKAFYFKPYFIIPHFLGNVKQIPSKFSAIKVNGQRAYDLARKGVEFELKSREITIFSLKMTQNNEDFADFEAKCSKGTYIRTLAHDICQKLGTQGHVVRLERLQVGDFDVKNALDFDKIRNWCRKFMSGAKLV